VNFVTGALAHLQLGRAQVMMGDKAAARKSYNDLLILWKDADLDVPSTSKPKLTTQRRSLGRSHEPQILRLRSAFASLRSRMMACDAATSGQASANRIMWKRFCRLSPGP
jgi:hypothetical protein